MTFKEWVIEIFKDERLLEAIINTVTVAVLSTLIATIVGTITAIGINSLRKNLRIKMMIFKLVASLMVSQVYA